MHAASSRPAPSRPGIPTRNSTPVLWPQAVSAAADAVTAADEEADEEADAQDVPGTPDARGERVAAPGHVWTALVDRPGPGLAGRSRLDVHAGEGWRRLVDREVRDLQARWRQMPESTARTRQPAWAGDYQSLKVRAAELVRLSNIIRLRERAVQNDVTHWSQVLADARRGLPAFAAGPASVPVVPLAVRQAIQARFDPLSEAVARAANERLAQVATYGPPLRPGPIARLVPRLHEADALAIALRARLPEDLAVSAPERRVVEFIDAVGPLLPRGLQGQAGALAAGSVDCEAGAPMVMVEALVRAVRMLADAVGRWYETDLVHWASPAFRANLMAAWVADPDDRERRVLTEVRVHALRLGGTATSTGARDAFIETWAAAADQAAGDLASLALHQALAGFAMTVDPTRGPGSEFSQAFVRIVLRHHGATPVPEARATTLRAIRRQLVALPVALGSHDENEAWMQFLRAAIRRPPQGAVARGGDARLWLDASDLAQIERQLARMLGLPATAPSLAPAAALALTTPTAASAPSSVPQSAPTAVTPAVTQSVARTVTPLVSPPGGSAPGRPA